MSTSFSYLPATRSSLFTSPHLRRKCTKMVRELLSAGLPETLQGKLFKSKLAVVVMGPEDLPVQASDQSPSLVFRKPVVFALGKIWIDASFHNQPEHLRASFFCAAGISAFAMRPDLKELKDKVARRVELEADDCFSENNIMRRTRNRSLMTGLSLLEAYAQEVFLTQAGTFSKLTARFGTNLCEMPQPQDLAQEVLLAAWNNILQFAETEKCPAPVTPLAHPFASSRLSLEQTYRWPTCDDLLEQDDPGCCNRPLCIPERLAADKFFPNRIVFDPRTWNLSSLDSVTSAAPLPLIIDTEMPFETKYYWERCAQSWPFGGVALYAMHRSGLSPIKDKGSRHTHNFCTCYLPTPANPSVPPKQALPAIPAIKSPKNTKVVEICAAQTANAFTSAWLELKTPYGAVHAICSSWLDQGEMLRLHEPYKAVLGFWVTDIEKVASGKNAAPGVFALDDDDGDALKSGKMLVRFYAGKRGERTRFGAKTMQTLLARTEPGAKDSEIYLAVNEKKLLQSGVAEGDFFQAQGYFIVESFAPLETFAESLGLHERLVPAMIPERLPFENSPEIKEDARDFLGRLFKNAVAEDLLDLFAEQQSRSAFTQPCCVRSFDEVLAQSLSAGQHAAFNIAAKAGIAEACLAPDMINAAAFWFAHHGTNPNALFLSVLPLLAHAEIWELDKKTLSKVREAAALACRSSETINDARVLLARVLDQASQKRKRSSAAYSPTQALLFEYFSHAGRHELTQYLQSAYGIWGKDVWKTTFEERLKKYVSLAADGGIAYINCLIAMLAAESGLLGTDVLRFYSLPGRMHDETRRDLRLTTIAALKLRQWMYEQTGATNDLKNLHELAVFDASSAGSEEQVRELIENFDLWKYLDCRPFSCSRPLLEQNLSTFDDDQSGRNYFWNLMLSISFLKENPPVDPSKASPELKAEITERVRKEAFFVISHSTPFIPDLASMQYGKVSAEDGFIMRYGDSKEPLQDAAMLSILLPDPQALTQDFADDDEADFEEDEQMQPVGIPYFSQSTECTIRLAAAAQTSDGACGNLSSFLCDENISSAMMLHFVDIFWPYMKRAYNALDVWKAQVYCVCVQLSAVKDAPPSNLDKRQTLAWNPHQPSCMLAVGTVTSKICNWGEVAGVSFDQLRIKVAALEGLVQDAEIVAYHPSAARSDEIQVGTSVFFHALCYGYVTEAAELNSRNMLLN